jgi:hypothetical protein
VRVEEPVTADVVLEPEVVAPAAERTAEVRDVPEPVVVVEETELVMEEPVLARTASDPAPLPMDATAVLPPLSLLPPPAQGAGPGAPLLSRRPPVPPARRRTLPLDAGPTRALTAAVAPEPEPGLATVTRLPGTVEMPAVQPGTALARLDDVAPPVVVGLTRLGVPAELLGDGFAEDAAARGTYAALTSALQARLPVPPAVPAGPGEVLLVVGPGAETLAAARTVAATLRLDPEDVVWAVPGDLAALAPDGARVTGVPAARERRAEADRSGEVTVVAVHAPMRSAGWAAAMTDAFAPAAVWAVADATRKPEDLAGWLGALPRVDALVLQDTDLSADPAAVLALDVPVAVLDGVRATPHRWASLLCERSEAHGG